MDCLFTPVGTGKIPAGYEAAPVCGIIARINNPDGLSIKILGNETIVNEKPLIGTKEALSCPGVVYI